MRAFKGSVFVWVIGELVSVVLEHWAETTAIVVARFVLGLW